MKKHLILAINPGSTSTKIAIFFDENCVAEKSISHDAQELKKYKQIKDQLPFRKEAVLNFIKETEYTPDQFTCIVGRGGFLRPIDGGTYLINDFMCHELENAQKEHASNLGGLIAKGIADGLNIPAYIVDPIVVDELGPLARISGIKDIERKSIFHALNQKAIARKAAEKLNKKYEECNLIVAHMGGGVSVGAHEKGQVIDVNNALDGDGPLSPERAGALPVGSVIDLCFHSGMSESEIRKYFVGKGGLFSYLGTTDARKVEKQVEEGDAQASLIYEAMAYQVAKEIGGCAAVLKGKIDAIVLTGGMAYSKLMTRLITERVEFMAPVMVLPGENEMEALVLGALRVTRGEEAAKVYGE